MLDFRVENDQYDASLPMLIFINIQEEFEDTKGVELRHCDLCL
jgi:hypothetical protein